MSKGIHNQSKIYVAGHTGLVGSAIVRQLNARDYRNVVYRTHAELDLTNSKPTSEFFNDERPEIVILAAAVVGGINANNETPVPFIVDNLAIQTNVINAAFEYGVKRLLFLGSSCIYPVKKSILNTTISKTLYKHLLLQVLLSYVDVEVITKVNKPFVNPDIEENVFEETNETLMDKMSDIMTLILDVFHYQKSAINFSMEEIQNNVLNIKEMEKTGVVERLKNMSKEDRKSEDYMKNLRLGDWNLGQTKSLYIYDPSQYDKEVHTEEKEREIRSGIRNKETRNGGTMDSFQEDIAVEEMMKDSETNRLVEQEMMQDMMGMGEDDDYGDMDGDEMF